MAFTGSHGLFLGMENHHALVDGHSNRRFSTSSRYWRQAARSHPAPLPPRSYGIRGVKRPPVPQYIHCRRSPGLQAAR